MLSDEFYANYDAIQKAFPSVRVLTVGQMAGYLMISRRSLINAFGISTKLTVESFAARLAGTGKEKGK